MLTTFDEAKSDEEVAQAVLRLGVASTKEPNPELVKRFAKAMKSHYPGVRSAALVAVSYGARTRSSRSSRSFSTTRPKRIRRTAPAASSRNGTRGSPDHGHESADIVGIHAFEL